MGFHVHDANCGTAWKAIEAEVTAGISEEIELMVARAPIVAHDMVVRHVERFCVERRPSIFFLPCGEVVARDPEVEVNRSLRAAVEIYLTACLLHSLRSRAGRKGRRLSSRSSLAHGLHQQLTFRQI